MTSVAVADMDSLDRCPQCHAPLARSVETCPMCSVRLAWDDVTRNTTPRPQRLASWAIDTVVLLVLLGIGLAAFEAVFPPDVQEHDDGVAMLSLVVLLGLPGAMFVVGEAVFGGSVGKHVAGLRVVSLSTGLRPSVGTAMRRYALRFVSVAPAGLGYLAVLGGRRAAWHDAWTSTAVVKRGTPVTLEMPSSDVPLHRVEHVAIEPRPLAAPEPSGVNSDGPDLPATLKEAELAAQVDHSAFDPEPIGALLAALWRRDHHLEAARLSWFVPMDASERARLMLDAGDYGSALELVNERLLFDPADQEALAMKAQAMLRSRTASTNELRRAAERVTSDPATVATILVYLDEIEQATELLASAAADDPSTLEARVLIALSQRRYDEACEIASTIESSLDVVLLRRVAAALGYRPPFAPTRSISRGARAITSAGRTRTTQIQLLVRVLTRAPQSKAALAELYELSPGLPVRLLRSLSNTEREWIRFARASEASEHRVLQFMGPTSLPPVTKEARPPQDSVLSVPAQCHCTDVNVLRSSLADTYARVHLAGASHVGFGVVSFRCPDTLASWVRLPPIETDPVPRLCQLRADQALPSLGERS